MLEAEKCHTEGESDKLFAGLFPNGFAGEDVLAEIAPEGWSQSTLRFVFHPTVDQVYFEAVQTHEDLKDWGPSTTGTTFLNGDGAEELYDLESDPLEKHDVARSPVNEEIMKRCRLMRESMLH